MSPERFEDLLALVEHDLPAAVDQIPPGHYAFPIKHIETEETLGWQVAEKTKRTNIFRTWRRLEGEVPKNRVTDAFRDLRPHAEMSGLGDEKEIVFLILLDPTKVAARYGAKFGRCGICHRPLSDPESRTRGIGPECIRRAPALRGEIR